MAASPMPFCLGCHTAYNWPLLPAMTRRITVFALKRKRSWNLSIPLAGGSPSCKEGNACSTHALFTNYTRSVTGLRSAWIEFGSRKHGRRVRIRRGSFSYLAMWTPHDHEAPLLCLEPCTGLQPGNHGCLRLEDRDGCVTLSPGEVWEGSFWLSFS